MHVQIISRSKKATTGSLQIESLSVRKRLFKACLRSLITLILSAMAIAIPILHFILVPIGLIFTILIFIHSYNQKSIIKSGKASCPDCGANIRILQRPAKVPFDDVCETCRRGVRVVAVSDC